jgi:hypothetical protein
VVGFRDVKIGADDGDVQIESGLKEGVSVERNPGSQIAFGRNVDAHDVGVWLAGMPRCAGVAGKSD